MTSHSFNACFSHYIKRLGIFFICLKFTFVSFLSIKCLVSSLSYVIYFFFFLQVLKSSLSVRNINIKNVSGLLVIYFTNIFSLFASYVFSLFIVFGFGCLGIVVLKLFNLLLYLNFE
jgi:hypothetical protein